MHLTVDQVYKIAQKLLEDEYVLELHRSSAFSKWSLTNIAILVLSNAGDGPGPLLKTNGFGDSLGFVVKNGRIYSYVYNMKYEYHGKKFPITDQILKDFDLTLAGEEFIKKYL